MEGRRLGSVSSATGEICCGNSSNLVLTYRPYGLAVPYRKFHDKFASIVGSHGGRPHWAKEHVLKPKDLEALYPDFGKFKEVVARVDPAGIMRSEYVRRHIVGEDIPRRFFKERA